MATEQTPDATGSPVGSATLTPYQLAGSLRLIRRGTGYQWQELGYTKIERRASDSIPHRLEITRMFRCQMKSEPTQTTVDPRDRELTDRLMGLKFRESLPAVAASYDELVAMARIEERGRCAAIVECGHPDALNLIRSGATAWSL